MSLSDQHRAYLLENAVTAEVIDAAGIYSEDDVIVFPWVNTDGTTTEQRKPYVPSTKTGYLWEPGKPLHPWVLRELDDDGPVLVVEGTKQSLAAASWAPAGYSVYGMAGCWGLSKADLSFAEDRDVFIILDADASTNLDVYDAGSRLKTRFEDEDARVGFVRLPVEDKEGLDDYLASIRPEKRTARLAKRISEAVAKPADRKPAPKQGKARNDEPVRPESGGRDVVAVNGDLKEVVDNLVAALRTRHDGHYLFNYGRALTCVEGPSTLPLEDGDFLRLLADTVMMVVHKPATSRAPEQFLPGGRPDTQTIKAVMASFSQFTELMRVVRSPFVRPDGSICSTPGYDAATKTLLISDLAISVPENPTDAERSEALSLLLDDWMADMPFPTEGDRANALAAMLTPFVRGLFHLSPMAIINGLQMGVGKNLFVDCLAMLSTGEFAAPMPYVNDDDETRKQITAAFRSGTELLAFDEAHVIEGASLARALTSITYKDRILSQSRMAEFPNNVTWMAMGNSVQVNGDVARRVYWVELKPRGANPQDREASSFRHPDLKGWTQENRGRLVSAVLTLVRAWFAAGEPRASRGTSLGSFEGWDRVVGGIVGYAGVQGFLGEIQTKRSESDFDAAYWTAHIQWLREVFGADSFTTADVRTRGMEALSGYEAPPAMEDLSDKGYTRALGKRYAQKTDRWYGNLRITKAGMGHRSTIKWTVEEAGEEVLEGTEGMAPPPAYEEKTQTLCNSACVCVRTYGRSADGPSVPSVPSEGVGELDIADELGREVGTVGYTCTHGPHQNERHAVEPVLNVGVPSSLPGHGAVDVSGDRPTDQGFPCRTRREGGVHRGAQEHVGGMRALQALIAFDLETCSVDEMHRREDFVRIGSAAGCTSVPSEIPSVVGYLHRAVDAGKVITGHNIIGFDLAALARWHGADYEKLCAGSFDTLIAAKQLDPPLSKGMPNGYYKLDVLAERLGVTGKTNDIKALARKHGGFDAIPLDDSEYVEYLQGDVTASQAVAEVLYTEALKDPYIAREHRVAAIMGRMSLNGFRVDDDLARERYQAGQDKLSGIKETLHGRYGFPSDGAAPQRSNAGKAALYEALRAAGLGPQWLEKNWPKNKDGTLSLAKPVLQQKLEELRGVKTAAADLCEAILEMNGVRSIYGNCLDWMTPEGRVHPDIFPEQASGRWSVTKPGLTVVGKRGGKVTERAIYIADPGEVLVAFDADQVDMRAIAAASQDRAYMGLFIPRGDGARIDPHTDIAAMVGLSRQDAKVIGHGFNYGMGVEGQVRNGVDRDKAEQFAARMRESFPRLEEWKREIRQVGEATGLLANDFGRRMRLNPEYAYTQAPALMGQGGTRDILAEGLLKLPAEILPMLRVVVHDEIVLSIPEDIVEDVCRTVIDCMTFELKGVPITWGQSKAGKNWAACY
jgi:DNA polymerase I-like protein with 3'-5' exonuclease and polymerase domains